MAWDVEFSDEFGAWWNGLNPNEQISVRNGVKLLQDFGPNLSRPYADSLYGSKYNLKELRIQHQGRPYRVLFAFDPRRIALLLSAETKQETLAGTTNSFRRRKRSTSSI